MGLEFEVDLRLPDGSREVNRFTVETDRKCLVTNLRVEPPQGHPAREGGQAFADFVAAEVRAALDSYGIDFNSAQPTSMNPGWN